MTEKQSSSDRAYGEIKRKILSMEYMPGQPLTEMALSEELGVSRTPVRVALKLLAKDKLVDFIPNKGAFVKELSMVDINELFTIREIMEGYCAWKACEQITDESIRYLEDKLDEAHKQLEAGDYTQASITAAELHQVLIGLTGNSRIRDILAEIGQDVGRLQHLTVEVPEKLTKSDEEHRAILNALKERNGELAEKLMKAHIRGVKRDAIFEYVTKTDKVI